MGPYVGHAQRRQIIHRCAQSNRLDKRRGAGFELQRHIVPTNAIKSDIADHVAARHKGWHSFQQFWFAIQHADAGGTEHFVARENIKVTVHRCDVDWHVGHSLRPIYNNFGTNRARRLDQGRWIGNGAQHIGHLRKTDQPSARRHKLI